MVKKAPSKKHRTTKKHMDKEQDKGGPKEDRTPFMIEVDRELDALRAICNAIEGMDESAKLRTFQYLKSRYGKSFPYENN
jgi:hypothetical protein